MKEVWDFVMNNHILQAVLVIGAAIFLSNIIRKYLDKVFKAGSLHLRVDPTQFNFFKNASSALIYGGAIAYIFFTIPSLKALGATLFAGAGILAAVLAFASQQAMSNIINGVFLVMFKPFRVGDIIHVGDLHMGEVEDITLRHTIIKNFENRRIIIPNSIIGNEVIVNSNLKDSLICSFMEYGISYDSDVDLARKIIFEESVKHPNFLDHRSPEEIEEGKAKLEIKMVEHGDFAIKLRAYFWAESPTKARFARFDLLESIKKRFDAEGIEIPFPYRTIVYKDKSD